MENNLQKIWDMQEDLNKIIGRDTVGDSNKEKWLFDYITAMEQEIAELKDCLNWKWWSKEYEKHEPYGIMDKQNLKVELIDILHFLISTMQIAGFTADEVMDVYKQKHRINIERQKKSYNHIGKTEEDNKTIKVSK